MLAEGSRVECAAEQVPDVVLGDSTTPPRHQLVFDVGKVFIHRCDVQAAVAGGALHAGHAAVERGQVGVFSEDRVNKPLGADDLVELLVAE